MITMLFLLAQAAPAAPPLDLTHYLLAAMVPVLIGIGFAVGKSFGNKAVVALEEKLKATGHPQAAQTVQFLAVEFARIATETEKAALAQAASKQGLDHPAISVATDGKGL